MSCIKTYSGIMFDPLNPDYDLIDITDIAHALSMLCRANGHFRTFYSVGQHCINCAKEAAVRGYSTRVQLACLLHDASEAYLSDVTRPVKQELPRYSEIEKSLQDIIWSKYMGSPLSQEEYTQVFEVDDALLFHEFVALMDTHLTEYAPELKSNSEFVFSGFEHTKQAFLRLFHALSRNEHSFFTVGIDWMSPNWVAVELQDSEATVRCFKHIDELCNAYRDVDAILIDIPIGLPENKQEAALRPDALARKLLTGKRKSSVFNVLPRQIVYAETSKEAWDLNGQMDAKMTPPGEGLRAIIREVDVFLQHHPEWKNRLLESHPEVAFQILNGGQGLLHSKHTESGLQERIIILERYGILPNQILRKFNRKVQADILDATVLAVSGQLGCQNGFSTVPEYPACDSHGLRMQMCFGQIL